MAAAAAERETYMPNHVTNVLEFECTPERFRRIAESLRSNPDEPLGQVDFNTLIPMPESLAIEAGSRGEEGYRAYREFAEAVRSLDGAGKEALEKAYEHRFRNDPGIWELGKQYYENKERYGATNWYGWCCEHWNTKWNAYECLAVSPEDRRLQFLTAWSPVPGIAEAISKKCPEAIITYRWADEDIGFNVGECVIQDGQCLEDRTPREGSREAFELAADIMGEDLADWGFTLSKDGSTYEWRDEEPVPERSGAAAARSGDAR